MAEICFLFGFAALPSVSVLSLVFEDRKVAALRLSGSDTWPTPRPLRPHVKRRPVIGPRVKTLLSTKKI